MSWARSGFEIAEVLGDLVVNLHPTGSAFTVSPPVLDTDIDMLVLVSDLDHATSRLVAASWTNCVADWQGREDMDPGTSVDAGGYAVEDKYGARFCAFRHGQLNIIATDDVTFYLRSVGATLIAKQLNLRDKADRIALFRAIKYGEPYQGPMP